MADIKIKASPDEIQQVMGQVLPPAPPPPAPPMPTPAQAGYAAFASDPLNQQAVKKTITPPGTSVLPPSVAAPQPWNPPSTPPSSILPPGMSAPMASVNPPKPQMAAANPPAAAPPPSIYGMAPSQTAMIPSVAGKTPAPQTVNPMGAPNQEEYFVQHPGQQARKQFSGGGVVQNILNGLAAGTLGAAGGMKGNPSAGADWVAQGAARDAQVPELNNQRYRAAIVQPQIDALAAQQGAANLAHTQAQTGDIDAREQQQAAQHGLMKVTDANGVTSLVVDPDSPITKANTDKDAKLQTQTSLITSQIANTKAQTELRDAQTAYNQAKTNPDGPLFKQVSQRLAIAQQNAGAAQQRAQAYWGNYLQHSTGVGLDGKPLAGDMIADNGQPVGSANAVNVRPTGAQRSKGNMADSAAEQLTDIKGILQKHASMFGPGYGQSTQFQKWVGSQDPDAQRFLSARTIAADHLAATFGGRSETALTALDNAIGQFKDNPKASLAGIDQLTKANTVFQNAGKVRTVGSNAANNMAPPTQGMMFARDPQGKLHQAPAGTGLPPGWKAGK